MRVCSGTAKGRRIKTRKGFSTRPLLSRVRKSLFDLVGEPIKGKGFLDLYAGSGAVGIEAISRGASEAAFVEIDPECVRLIRENLFHCSFLSRAKIYQKDVLHILFSVLGKGNFPFIFVGPPYFQNLQNKTLNIIQGITYYQGQVIVQHSPREKIDLEYPSIELTDHRKYGDTCLSFFLKRAVTQ